MNVFDSSGNFLGTIVDGIYNEDSKSTGGTGGSIGGGFVGLLIILFAAFSTYNAYAISIIALFALSGFLIKKNPIFWWISTLFMVTNIVCLLLSLTTGFHFDWMIYTDAALLMLNLVVSCITFFTIFWVSIPAILALGGAIAVVTVPHYLYADSPVGVFTKYSDIYHEPNNYVDFEFTKLYFEPAKGQDIQYENPYYLGVEMNVNNIGNYPISKIYFNMIFEDQAYNKKYNLECYLFEYDKEPGETLNIEFYVCGSNYDRNTNNYKIAHLNFERTTIKIQITKIKFNLYQDDDEIDYKDAIPQLIYGTEKQ